MASKKAKGIRANTRHLFKGIKLSIERLLMNFKIGDSVVVKPNGRYHSGLPFRRFAGHVGVVEKKVGRTTYKVHIKDLNKDIIVGNAHIKKVR